VKRYLEGGGFKVAEVLHDDPAEKEAFFDGLGLKRAPNGGPGERTFPQVIAGKTRIGGFMETLQTGGAFIRAKCEEGAA
jgi:glutaredoxin